ncbi:MAG TPA: MATE family efflux transporter [Pseudomonas sp.]|nr:MATE family efflux transporter [Pseudomonas sp.]
MFRLLFNDWRHAPTRRRVWALTVPMLLSSLSVPLVALVDTAVIGHLSHAHQLGAVAVGGSLYTLLIWCCGFLRMGTTGFAAQASGRGDGAALRQLLLQAGLLSLALAVLLGLLALPLSGAALALMEPSAALDELARDYFHIRLFGLPAMLASQALIGWFLGAQNARAALAILLTINLLNLLLDLWFVLGLEWGVAGAARASVTAEWSGALLGLLLCRGELARHAGALRLEPLRHWRQWRPLLAVNRDILIRSLVLQGVFFLVTVQGARLGDVTVAANALLLNGLLLTAHALDGLAHALEALCGHAIGARDRVALRRSLVVAGGWSLLGSLGFALLFLLGGEHFLRLQSDMPEVLAAAREYLPWLALLPLLTVWSYLLDGLFIGATRAREMRDAMLLAALLALPAGWLLQDWGNHGLWLAFCLFMLLRSLGMAVLAWRLWPRLGAADA